jgi:hypothetical protein
MLPPFKETGGRSSLIVSANSCNSPLAIWSVADPMAATSLLPEVALASTPKLSVSTIGTLAQMVLTGLRLILILA